MDPALVAIQKAAERVAIDYEVDLKSIGRLQSFDRVVSQRQYQQGNNLQRYYLGHCWTLSVFKTSGASSSKIDKWTSIIAMIIDQEMGALSTVVPFLAGSIEGFGRVYSASELLTQASWSKLEQIHADMEKMLKLRDKLKSNEILIARSQSLASEYKSSFAFCLYEIIANGRYDTSMLQKYKYCSPLIPPSLYAPGVDKAYISEVTKALSAPVELASELSKLNFEIKNSLFQEVKSTGADIVGKNMADLVSNSKNCTGIFIEDLAFKLEHKTKELKLDDGARSSLVNALRATVSGVLAPPPPPPAAQIMQPAPSKAESNAIAPGPSNFVLDIAMPIAKSGKRVAPKQISAGPTDALSETERYFKKLKSMVTFANKPNMAAIAVREFSKSIKSVLEQYPDEEDVIFEALSQLTDAVNVVRVRQTCQAACAYAIFGDEGSLVQELETAYGEPMQTTTPVISKDSTKVVDANAMDVDSPAPVNAKSVGRKIIEEDDGNDAMLIDAPVKTSDFKEQIDPLADEIIANLNDQDSPDSLNALEIALDELLESKPFYLEYGLDYTRSRVFLEFVQNIDVETIRGEPIVIHVNAVENLTSFAIYFIHYALKIYKPEFLAIKCSAGVQKSTFPELSTIFNKFLVSRLTKRGNSRPLEFATFMCDTPAGVKIQTTPASA